MRAFALAEWMSKLAEAGNVVFGCFVAGKAARFADKAEKRMKKMSYKKKMMMITMMKDSEVG